MLDIAISSDPVGSKNRHRYYSELAYLKAKSACDLDLCVCSVQRLASIFVQQTNKREGKGFDSLSTDFSIACLANTHGRPEDTVQTSQAKRTHKELTPRQSIEKETQ